MTQATDRDIQQLTKIVTDLAKEVHDGFANIDTKFANVDTKFANVETKLSDIRGDIRVLDSKFEERTKNLGDRLGARESIGNNITSGITNIVVGGIILAIAKFLFGIGN